MALNEIKLLALIGLIISVYAAYVKRNLEKTINYKPLCDISKNISCSKAFLSNFSRLFVLPNAVFGVAFYAVIYLLASFEDYAFVFYLSLIAAIFSLYMAYVSYFKQKNFCLVCTASYIVNILLLYFSYVKIYI